jgi:predicted nucleic acid-binding protein
VTLVVADTGPLNYLYLLGHFELLPKIYSEVLVPPAVVAEMSHSRAPSGLRAVAADPPAWLRIHPVVNVRFLDQLDLGEAEALSLALELKAQRILIDERDGRLAAASLGFEISGTLGILEEGAERHLLSLPQALAALTGTRFRIDPDLLQAALRRDALRRSRQP